VPSSSHHFKKLKYDYKFLCPWKIGLGTIRRDPVFLRAPPIGSPKLVLASGIVAIHDQLHEYLTISIG
jgi:hypothetical protein